MSEEKSRHRSVIGSKERCRNSSRIRRRKRSSRRRQKKGGGNEKGRRKFRGKEGGLIKDHRTEGTGEEE